MYKYKEFTFDQYRVVFGYDYDDCYDISYLGKGVTEWESGAIPFDGPILVGRWWLGDSSYRAQGKPWSWFVPANSFAESLAWYMAEPNPNCPHSMEYQGKDRAEAGQIVAKRIKQDIERYRQFRANEVQLYVLSVKIYFKGHEVASDYLGGIESDSGDDYLLDAYKEMLSEAIDDAERTVEAMGVFNRDDLEAYMLSEVK